jgi:hypothetical protein
MEQISSYGIIIIGAYAWWPFSWAPRPLPHLPPRCPTNPHSRQLSRSRPSSTRATWALNLRRCSGPSRTGAPVPRRPLRPRRFRLIITRCQFQHRGRSWRRIFIWPLWSSSRLPSSCFSSWRFWRWYSYPPSRRSGPPNSSWWPRPPARTTCGACYCWTTSFRRSRSRSRSSWGLRTFLPRLAVSSWGGARPAIRSARPRRRCSWTPSARTTAPFQR